MDHFVDDDVFQAGDGFLAEFEVEPDTPGLDGAASPSGFHVLDAPGGDLGADDRRSGRGSVLEKARRSEWLQIFAPDLRRQTIVLAIASFLVNVSTGFIVTLGPTFFTLYDHLTPSQSSLSLAIESVISLVVYYLGYVFWQAGQPDLAHDYWQDASEMAPDYCFPNTLDDLLALECALQEHPTDAMAHYYLGNLLYDKQRHLDAINHWEQARSHNSQFAIVQRNLALAYCNVLKQPAEVLLALKTAFALNTWDDTINSNRHQIA